MIMPSEKVVETLDRLGIEVPSEEFGHYGVKGMKWDSKLTPEERAEKERINAEKLAGTYVKGDEKYDTKGDSTFLNDKLSFTTTYSSRAEVEQWAKGKKSSRLFDVTKTVKDLKGTRSATRQGRVNAFIENAFNKLMGKKKNK